MVGNKIDLTSRQVARKQAEAYAEDNGIQYFECSAKTGQGIPELFEYVENTAKEAIKLSKAESVGKTETVQKVNVQAV